MRLFLALVLLLGLAQAYVLHLVTPVNTYLEPLVPSRISPVGPGYKVILAFDRNTEEGFVWDNLECVSCPDWNITYARDHKYLYAFIRVPKDSKAGSYQFSFRVQDKNGDHVQENAIVEIDVTNNPDDLAHIGDLDDAVLIAGNTSISFILDNKALGEARYRISYWVDGLGSWEKEIRIKPGNKERISLPLYLPTGGFYTVHVKVESLDTPIVHRSMDKKYYARPTLKSKFSSVASGFPVVPIPMAPVYVVLGLVSLVI